jgi:hypothetical protein
MFQQAMYDLATGVHGDLSSAVLKLAICDDTITPVANTATPRWSDFSANEVTDAGNYIAGGITLTTVVVAMVDGVCTITADDVNIGIHASGFEDGYWAFVVNTSAGDDEILGFWEMGGPVSEKVAPVDFEFPSGVVIGFPANVLTWETPLT